MRACGAKTSSANSTCWSCPCGPSSSSRRAPGGSCARSRRLCANSRCAATRALVGMGGRRRTVESHSHQRNINGPAIRYEQSCFIRAKEIQRRVSSFFFFRLSENMCETQSVLTRLYCLSCPSTHIRVLFAPGALPRSAAPVAAAVGRAPLPPPHRRVRGMAPCIVHITQAHTQRSIIIHFSSATSEETRTKFVELKKIWRHGIFVPIYITPLYRPF